MPNLFLISDTHFGHQGMCEFLRDDGTKMRPWTNFVEMDAVIMNQWNKVVGKRDKVYHLGDVVINRRFLSYMTELNGEKILIKGNHDIFKLSDYTPHFKDIRACHRLDKNYVLSHIPIHQDSLKKEQYNLHGHLHHKNVMKNGQIDPQYVNLSVEQINYTPVSFEELKKSILQQAQAQK